MIITGIDPGSNVTGYAFLQKTRRGLRVLEYGAIRTKPADSLVIKLQKIYLSLSELFHQYKPEQAAIETAFVARYPRAALVLGHTRGVIMIAASVNNIQIHEYEPRLIKKAVVGIGKASKKQVASMIQKRLRLHDFPKPHDAADALAVAYCHVNIQRTLL